MTRRPSAPFGEQTEREIREWVRGRDAGPAPERLRMRIARVAEAEPTPRWGIRAILRPAYAVTAAVAAAAFLMVAMVVRSVPGPAANPGASATPSGPSPEPTPILMPAMPNGPWPRTGPVLAVPLDGPLLATVAALALLAALLIVVWIAIITRREARDAEPPTTWSWLGLWASRRRRTRAARGLAVVLAGVMIAVGCGLLQFAQSTPLTYGSASSGGTLGSRTGTGNGSGEEYDPFVPGGQIDMIVDLANWSDLPLTVTSFDEERFLREQTAGPFISSVELRLPPGAAFACEDSQTTASRCKQPFHPFELQPRTETVIAFVVHLKDCKSAVPGPTPGPGSNPTTEYLPTTGYVTFGDLPFRYSVLGIERETDVRMNFSVGLVFGSSEVAC
jgi:hypothetical protein